VLVDDGDGPVAKVADHQDRSRKRAGGPGQHRKERDGG
jgi:hypothetical protein